jgi:hypothetical protein
MPDIVKARIAQKSLADAGKGFDQNPSHTGDGVFIFS